MITGILGLLSTALPFLFKIANLWLDKTGASNQEKLDFLNDFAAISNRADEASRARRHGINLAAQMDSWEKGGKV